MHTQEISFVEFAIRQLDYERTKERKRKQEKSKEEKKRVKTH